MDHSKIKFISTRGHVISSIYLIKNNTQTNYDGPRTKVFTTVYVKAISFSGLCASSIGSKFDQTRVRRLSSPRPNPELSFSFSLRYSAGACRRKSQHFKTSLPVAAVWLSVYSKIHESCKSEVKPNLRSGVLTFFSFRGGKERLIQFFLPDYSSAAP